MTYQEFQALTDEYQGHIAAYVIRKERDRPMQEQLDALTAAVKAKDALWEAIRAVQPTAEQP